jgi:hypothetical protein
VPPAASIITCSRLAAHATRTSGCSCWLLALQVPAAHVTVVNDPRLQDGMGNAWVPAVVAHHVQKQLQQTRCDTVSAALGSTPRPLQQPLPTV